MAVWNRTNLVEVYVNRRIDSEFFRPTYVQAEERIRRCKVEDLGKIGGFIPGPFGSAFHVRNYDFQRLYRYIRGRDVKPFFLTEDDNRYIPSTDFARLQKYAIQNNDLMISVVGTLGNVAVYTRKETPAIFSCKSTLFRSIGADPYYLLAYLNSNSGQICLLRRQRGAVQTGLNIEDLRTVPVPRFDERIESSISRSVRDAQQNLISCRDSYFEAQQLLETEVGLNKLRLQKPVGYAARFSTVERSGRADADYFQPKYEQVKEIVMRYKNGWMPLTYCATALRPNINPSATPNEVFNYVELADINASIGRIEGSERIQGRNLPSRARRLIQHRDVIASSVVGSVDKAALADTENEGFIASTGFFHFRPSGVSSEYFLILVRSRLVTMQLMQEATGGILSAVPDTGLRHIIVPKIDKGLQDQISALVAKAHQSKKKSDYLLEQAKISMEQLIEKAVKL